MSLNQIVARKEQVLHTGGGGGAILEAFSFFFFSSTFRSRPVKYFSRAAAWASVVGNPSNTKPDCFVGDDGPPATPAFPAFVTAYKSPPQTIHNSVRYTRSDLYTYSCAFYCTRDAHQTLTSADQKSKQITKPKKDCSFGKKVRIPTGFLWSSCLGGYFATCSRYQDDGEQLV